MIIAIPVLSLMGKIHGVKLFMIHMLAILSTLWLTFANQVRSSSFSTAHNNAIIVQQGYQQVRGGNSGISSARINTAIAGACVLFVTNLLAALIIELDSAAVSDEIHVAAPSGKGVRVVLCWCCCFNACINRPRLSPSCRCRRRLPLRPRRPCDTRGVLWERPYMYRQL